MKIEWSSPQIELASGTGEDTSTYRIVWSPVLAIELLDMFPDGVFLIFKDGIQQPAGFSLLRSVVEFLDTLKPDEDFGEAYLKFGEIKT